MVKRFDTSLGVEYRVSDWMYEFNVGSTCPELTEDNLNKCIADYLQMRFEDIEADCEEVIL